METSKGSNVCPVDRKWLLPPLLFLVPERILMRGSKREGGGGRFRLRSDGTTMALSLSLSPFNGSLTVNVTSPLDLPPPTEDELFGCGSCLVTFFIVGGKGCSLLHKHSSPSSSHPFPILSPFPSHLIRKATVLPPLSLLSATAKLSRVDLSFDDDERALLPSERPLPPSCALGTWSEHDGARGLPRDKKKRHLQILAQVCL